MNKVYISDDTFSAFISFIQKGILNDMRFFVYDEQNILKERIWTFSSTAFIPNVKFDDQILKKNQVPVVICLDAEAKSYDETSIILYETISKNICMNKNFIAFVKSIDDANNIKALSQERPMQAFQKVGTKWISE